MRKSDERMSDERKLDRAEGDDLGTRYPLHPWFIISTQPPTEVAITGNECAIASRIVMGSPSQLEERIKMSEDSERAEVLVTKPVKVIRFDKLSSDANAMVEGKRGPSPTRVRSQAGNAGRLESACSNVA